MPYHVCDDCAVVLENGDTSHIAESDMETVLSNIELMSKNVRTGDVVGHVVRTGEYDDGGYWYCHACMWTTIGSGHEYDLIPF